MDLSIKHLIHVILFMVHIVIFLKITGFMDAEKQTYKYDPTTTFVLYTLKLLTLAIGLPISLLNAAGILFYDVFPKSDRVFRRSAPLLYPFISFRVVTRGSYPDLVRRNVERNLRTCEEFGLDKFVIEVVTDRSIYSTSSTSSSSSSSSSTEWSAVPHSSAKVREIVVPSDYRTSTGAKYKARALQYALEPHVNILNDDDWIVHLDEETLLTRSALVGILNFMHDNKHQIGQGLITYGKDEVVSWMNTLADSIRVASDLGSLRFSLKTFHKPLYSFKGSFIVCQALVERLVSFENGIEGSIAEDSYFAIKAVNHGYSFDWVEGEMLEQSPFTFMDFVKQRKRWVQGLYLLVHDKHLKFNFSKAGFIFSFYIWMSFPIQFLISLIIMCHPISFSSVDEFLGRLNGVVLTYLFFLGAIKSLNFRRKSFVEILACILGVIFSIPFVMFCETIAICWGLCTDKNEFYITKKKEFVFSV